jgi:hypothetical protein
VVVTDLSGRLAADFDARSGRQIYDVVMSDQTIGFVDRVGRTRRQVRRGQRRGLTSGTSSRRVRSRFWA